MQGSEQEDLGQQHEQSQERLLEGRILFDARFGSGGEGRTRSTTELHLQEIVLGVPAVRVV